MQMIASIVRLLMVSKNPIKYIQTSFLEVVEMLSFMVAGVSEVVSRSPSRFKQIPRRNVCVDSTAKSNYCALFGMSNLCHVSVWARSS